MALKNPLMWAVVLVVALQVTGTVDFIAMVQSAGDAGDDEVRDQGGITSEGGIVCDDNADETGKSRIEDIGAKTLTYVDASEVYAIDPSDGIISNNATTSSTSPGFGSHTDSVICGTTYDLWAPVQAAVAGSTELKGVLAGRNGFKETLETQQIDLLQIRVEDIATDTFQSLNDSADTIATSFRVVNATQVFADTSQTDIAVGADGDLDYMIWVRSNSANKVIGDDGEKMWFTVDIGTGVEWQEPVVSVGGVSLTDQLALIDADSKLNSNIAAADYAYVIGNGEDYGRAISKIGFQIEAQSGENPDNSGDDVTICIVGEGQYKSSDEPDTIKTGIATDASGSAFNVVSALRTPCFTLNIS